MAVHEQGVVPYAPPKAVIDVIQKYRERPLPSPVTHDVLQRIGVSESLAPRTLQSLKILGLLDDSGAPTPSFDDLQRVSTPEFLPRVAELLKVAYAPIFAVIDPSGKTFQEVHDAFRGFKPAGQIDRAVTLFMGLLEFAGWTNLPTGSPKANKGPKAERTRRQSSSKNTASRSADEVAAAPTARTPATHSQTVVLRSGGSVTLVADINPLTLKGEERTFFFDLVDRLDEYESTAGASSPSGDETGEAGREANR